MRRRQRSTKRDSGYFNLSRRQAIAREGITHARRTKQGTNQTETEPGAETQIHRSSFRLIPVLENTGVVTLPM